MGLHFLSALKLRLEKAMRQLKIPLLSYHSEHLQIFFKKKDWICPLDNKTRENKIILRLGDSSYLPLSIWIFFNMLLYRSFMIHPVLSHSSQNCCNIYLGAMSIWLTRNPALLRAWTVQYVTSSTTALVLSSGPM